MKANSTQLNSTQLNSTQQFFLIIFLVFKITELGAQCGNFNGVISKTDVSCYRSSNGMARIDVTGGTPPYKYTWTKNKGTLNFAANLSPGNYKVTVEDSVGCSIQYTVSINEPDEIKLSFTGTSPLCGSSTGEIEVSSTGGIGYKKFYWTHSGSVNTHVTNLKSGKYDVIVTDSNGCSKIGKYRLQNNNNIHFNLKSDPPSCYRGMNGSAKIKNLTGSNPFRIKWSRSIADTLLEMNNARAGMYLVEITDSLGCIAFDSIEIEEPDTFKITLNTTNTRCGQNEGKIVPIVFGGKHPLQFSWMKPDRTEISTNHVLTNLNGGEGILEVTDANGCRTSSVYEVLDVGGLSVTGQVISEPACYLKPTGVAYVSVSGGTMPYTYSWFPTGGTNDTAINLTSDFYTVTVKDANGCRQKTKITVNCPDRLEANIFSKKPGNDSTFDGEARALVIGGTPPYSYSWASGSSNEKVSGLDYSGDSLVVTDQNGCVATNSIMFDPFPSTCNFPVNTLSPCYVMGYCDDCVFSVTRDIVTDFGAIPDDGISDNCAFEKASAFFQSVDPILPKTLTIPQGTYIVGRQDFPWQGKGNSPLLFTDLENLTIMGILPVEGDRTPPKIQFEDCMKFGLFDFPGGQPDMRYLSSVYQPGGNSHIYSAVPGSIIHIENCKNVVIQDLELDGNIDNCIIGGGYTQGIQLPYDGIFLNAAVDVTLNNLNVHHFGLDGLRIYFAYCTDPTVSHPGLMNLNIYNSQFLYNGRNGMSWCGGEGLQVYNSDFNYTGQSRIAMSPGDGVDIEFEGSNWPNRTGLFDNCNFKYNKNAGIESYSVTAPPPNTYHSRDVEFRECLFVGSEGNNFAGVSAWPNGRNFSFLRCNFYGRIWQPYYSDNSTTSLYNDNTKFEECNFDEIYHDPDIFPVTPKSIAVGHDLDPGTTNIPVGCPNPDHNWLCEFSTGMGVLMRDCNVNSNFNLKSINLSWDVFDPNSLSWNQLDNNFFRNFGLNACDCTTDVSSINCATMLSDNFVLNAGSWFPVSLRNPAPGGCPLAYHDESVNINTAFGNLIECNDPSCFLPLQPLAEEWYDPIDPNQVTETDLRPQPGDPDPYIIAPTYPLCNNGELVSRKSRLNFQKELSFHPNPTSDFLIIENVEPGQTISICNITGEILMETIITSSASQIDIKKFPSGVYILKSQNTKTYKFIKL